MEMLLLTPKQSLWTLVIATTLTLPGSAISDTPGDGDETVTDLMAQFHAIFQPHRLQPTQQHLAAKSPSCATTLLAHLYSHWDLLSPSQRHEVEAATSPYYRAWLANDGLSWRDGDVRAAQNAARDTCFPPEDALDTLGPYSHMQDSQHFAVYFDEGGDVTEERVGELLGWLEESLAIETDELGFYPPNLINDYQLLVAIEHLPSPNTGAFTSITSCGPGEQMAFMVINSQWFPDDQKLKSLAPHELFHAIQVRYAFDAFWGTADSPNQWWIEASAAYQERVVYPELDERQVEHALQWTREPWRSLQSHDSGGFQYGPYLLAASIHENLDGPVWHRELWDGFVGRSNFSVITDLDTTLSGHGSSFSAEYGLFIERAATMDFEFNDHLDTPSQVFDNGEGGLVASHEAADLPIDAAILPTNSPPAPEYLGTSYVQVTAPSSEQALLIEVEGGADSAGASLAWEVRLVAVRDGVAAASHRLSLEVGAGSGGSDSGAILLNGFGGAYDGLIIAVSPTLQDATEAATGWSYHLRLSEVTGAAGFSAVPEELLPGNGCGACSQNSLPLSKFASAQVLGFFLLALIQRRRRGRREARL